MTAPRYAVRPPARTFTTRRIYTTHVATQQLINWIHSHDMARVLAVVPAGLVVRSYYTCDGVLSRCVETIPATFCDASAWLGY